MLERKKTKNNPENQYLNKYIHKAVKENINLKNILKRKPYILPPWITKFNVNLSIAKFKKENKASIFYKNLLKNILDDHQNNELIYSDASKTNNGVGLSIISNNLIMLHRYPLHSSIFTTESLAIYKTIEHIHNNTENLHTNYTILSDSLSSFNVVKIRKVQPMLPSSFKKEHTEP